MTKEITPLPWKITDACSHLKVTDSNPKRQIAKISNIPKASKENAAYIVAACNSAPDLIQRIRELEKREKEGWMLADHKIRELKAVKNELKDSLKVIINKNEQLIDKNKQITELEAEADILADIIANYTLFYIRTREATEVKYWRNWERDKREQKETIANLNRMIDEKGKSNA